MNNSKMAYPCRVEGWMNVVESAETQSVQSSQSHNDASNDLTKVIEENSLRFSDIVNQSIPPVYENLEQELAKEDKKCTFLQYKIENLTERCNDAAETSATLQKSVRDQQMEIEKVSAAIYEQIQELNAKFPPDGLSHYSNTVSVISHAGECVESLKKALLQDIEENEKKTIKLLQQQQAVGIFISRTEKLIADKIELEKILKLRIHSVTNPDIDSFKTHLSLLNEKHNVYQKLKSEDNKRQTELEELKKERIEVLNACQTVNQTSFEALNKYNHIIISFRNQCDEIAKKQAQFENLYDQMMNDFNLTLTHLTEEIEKLDNQIHMKKRDLDRIRNVEETSMSENCVILSQIENLKLEYSKLEKYLAHCHQQEIITRSLKQSLLQQTDILKTTNDHCRILLEQLVQETEALEQEYNSSIIGLEDSSVESLQEKINDEQSKVECHLTNKEKLKNEIAELNEIIKNATNSNNELKNDLKLCQTEISIHDRFLEKSKYEYNESRRKQLAAVDEKVNNSLADITNAFSSTFEKQLIINSVQNDIQEYEKLSFEMQQEVWAANLKNENLLSELTQLRNVFSRENEAVESKKKLLEDLERNSFPKNKIPVNWFKSFEKQKQEYDLLVKQRLELEKERNKLIIEIDSQAFQENKNESLDTFESLKSSSSNMKNVMYGMFKERVRKRKSSTLKS